MFKWLQECAVIQYKEQIKKEWIARLEAKSKRLVVSEVDKKTSERRKEHMEIVKRIVAYTNNHSDSSGVKIEGKYYSVNDGLISKDDLEQGIRAVFPRCNDDRAVNNKIKMFVSSGAITWTEINNVIKGKPGSFGVFEINNMD